MKTYLLEYLQIMDFRYLSGAEKLGVDWMSFRVGSKVLRQVVEVKNPGQSRYDDQTTANAQQPRNNTGGSANSQIKNQSLQKFGHVSFFNWLR